ncbi:unnamed protein product [Phytomonas sp. EM1]|nr:unnamed protein product [Phytomonas sp. EM1]|eukprot:CCW61507.1 unnamed protein product [Phytomonas sp. isolate EM1]
MGAIFSLVSSRLPFKRPRGEEGITSSRALLKAHEAEERATVSKIGRSFFSTCENETDPSHAFLLRLRCRGRVDAGRTLCHCVVGGPSVELTYGCHFHLYETPDAGDSHGTALCWSLKRSVLSAAALVVLGRVANSCRKKMVVVDGKGMGIVLKYTTIV